MPSGADKEKPGSHSARPDVTIVQAYIQHPENDVKCLWPTYLIPYGHHEQNSFHGGYISYETAETRQFKQKFFSRKREFPGRRHELHPGRPAQAGHHKKAGSQE